jgi:TRAP-type C4-dicarboxylate transport system permease small subunit
MIGTVLLVVINVLMAAVGWRYLFRTEAVVTEARSRLEKKKWTQVSPSAGLATKSWYPTYVRCVGVVLWVLDLLMIYFLWFPKAPQ